jgi:hypothetical protein
MMLLKRHTFIKSKNQFIPNTLLMSLFNPLLLRPFNKDISVFMPKNSKSYIYTILSLPIAVEEKIRILSSNLYDERFLALLLLIQF